MFMNLSILQFLTNTLYVSVNRYSYLYNRYYHNVIIVNNNNLSTLTGLHFINHFVTIIPTVENEIHKCLN